jgi:hypothetical protein
MSDQPDSAQNGESVPIPGTIARMEWRWVWIYATLVMLVTTIPYLAGYASQTEAWRFTGFVFGVEDGNSYIAKMLSGEAGDWLFRTPYTAEPQRGVLAFLPYTLLGKLASPPALHEQLVALFHMFRILAGMLEILATYQFLAFFIRPTVLRRAGLVLATLGGGLGWLLILFGKDTLFGSLPLDFYSPETFGFLALYGLPHLALARACLLWGLLTYLKSMQRPARPAISDIGRLNLYWSLVALAQPLTGVILGFVLGLHWATLAIRLAWQKSKMGLSDNWRLLRSTGLIAAGGILPVPFLIYNALAFNLDPFLKRWTGQNIITSPHPVHYLLAYGLVIPFAIIGARKLLHDRPWDGWLLAAWALAIPFLAYAPFNLQRRLPEGAWVALVILLVKSFESEVDRVTRRSAWGINLLTAFSLPSTLFLLIGGLFTAIRPMIPVFRPVDEVTVFEQLEASAHPGDVVLSSYDTGNALPAWAPVRVVVGHGPESVGLADLLPKVQRFYSVEADDDERQRWMMELNIRYVFYGPSEAELGGWQPGNAPYLQLALKSGEYQVYQVYGK